MIMILSAGLLAVAALQSASPDWRSIVETPEMAVAWDAGNIERRRDLTAISVRMTPLPPRQGANAYAISRLEIRCPSNEGRVASTRNFSTDGSPGVSDNESLPFQPIPVDSFLSRLRDLVCAPRT
jgi:hypothetical protein